MGVRRREAHIISSLSHPHICTLHDIGTDADVDFLVMEPVEACRWPIGCAAVPFR